MNKSEFLKAIKALPSDYEVMYGAEYPLRIVDKHGDWLCPITAVAKAQMPGVKSWLGSNWSIGAHLINMDRDVALQIVHIADARPRWSDGLYARRLRRAWRQHATRG